MVREDKRSKHIIIPSVHRLNFLFLARRLLVCITDESTGVTRVKRGGREKMIGVEERTEKRRGNDGRV